MLNRVATLEAAVAPPNGTRPAPTCRHARHGSGSRSSPESPRSSHSRDELRAQTYTGPIIAETNGVQHAPGPLPRRSIRLRHSSSRSLCRSRSSTSRLRRSSKSRGRTKCAWETTLYADCITQDMCAMPATSRALATKLGAQGADTGRIGSSGFRRRTSAPSRSQPGPAVRGLRRRVVCGADRQPHQGRSSSSHRRSNRSQRRLPQSRSHRPLRWAASNTEGPAAQMGERAGSRRDTACGISALAAIRRETAGQTGPEDENRAPTSTGPARELSPICAMSVAHDKKWKKIYHIYICLLVAQGEFL